MSGGHWGYLSERLREQGGYSKLVWEAVGDLEAIVDWAESGDTVRLGDAEGWHVQFARAVFAALDSGDGPHEMLGQIAHARRLLTRRLSGEEWTDHRRDVLARTGRDVGQNDPRGAEAEAYDRLCKLFDELKWGFGWDR